MRNRALIVEPSRLFQGIIKELMLAQGYEVQIYGSAQQALEASHETYHCILVSRTLQDGLSGEIFLSRYQLKYDLGDAKAILLISTDKENQQLDAEKAGFSYVINRSDLQGLQDLLTQQGHSSSSPLAANILLVEDAQSSADLVSELFARSGSRVTHAATLAEAIASFEKDRFDLIISDYYLQRGETGDQVVDHIRNHDSDEKSNLPILIISGESDQKKRTAFLKNGANDFIIKPYHNDELIVRASNLIQNRQLINQVKSQNKKLMELALTDRLSGLYNRHGFYELADKYLSNARRHQIDLSLLVMDLDHFKQINDTNGHTAGDKVLKATAQLLKDLCRTEDVVARFGGEEFVMLLTSCDLSSAIKVAGRIKVAIAGLNPEGIKVTSSIGVAQLSNEDESFDALFDRADKAVYRAKELGRDRVEPPV